MDVDGGKILKHHQVRLSNRSTDSNPNSSSPVISHQQHQLSSYVIYRNSKYNGFMRRIKQYFIIFSRFYILQPLLSRLNQFHTYLLEFLGLLLLLFASPFLICSACVLYLIRRGRITLVHKFYPNTIICDDLSPRCILMGKSHGMVTAVIWTHGKITLQSLRSEIAPFKRSILRNRLADKFGLRVWMEPPCVDGEVEYDICNHIVEAPSKFYQVNLTDEDSSQGQKSSLQKFVTSCASKRMNPEKPPWEITLIPQPSRNKDRTCCVLRFHYLLLRDKNVRRFLGDIFTKQMESIKSDGWDFQYENNIHSNSDEPVKIILTFTTVLWNNIQNWIRNNFIVSKQDLKTWLNLRKKEWQFHSKTDLLRLKFFKFLVRVSSAFIILRSIWSSEVWTQLKEVIFAMYLIVRALCYIPIEIIECFWAASPEKYGIQRAGKRGTRQVAWSAAISKDFLEAIQEKIDAKPESIILTACSLALRDYYDETSLKNPESLYVSVPNISEDLLVPVGFKTLQLPTEGIQLPEGLNNVNSQLVGYPVWKILGSFYILTNVSYILPRAIAYLLLRKLFKRYPITVNFVDLESELPVILPTLSLWGQSVDEFIFWKSPQSDYCVSVVLVKYMKNVRLAVLSPMKTIDRALTKKFGQYLNRIAESLGVHKSRIPYSRVSSPSSSYCASPLSEVSFRSRIFSKR